ncbi:restriction endonuclease subunit S [Hymenobacter monticola]|uniref:Restriction endonuclease subunit S n=1 Tax=Hymenobacter monticola TaxID=1705399 RepID=A0ABY4B2D5_9BACT|nr:restriction endonuclease subunit S [Hymenobacter monticola]UOE33305.1 restriction endonuclease subunit S [Hymenobacter monticola]
MFFDELRRKYPAKPLRNLLTESKGGSWGSDYFDGGINAKVLRSPDIRFGFIDFEKAEERCFTQKEIDNFNLMDNDVVVIKSNGSLDLVGKSQVFKSDSSFPYVIASNFLLVLRPDQKRIWPAYLDLFLKSPQALAWKFDTQKTTTGLRNLDTKGFLSIEVPLPSTLLEQQQLVEDFEALVKGENLLESQVLFNAYQLCQNLKGIDEEHDQQIVHLTQLRQALLREAMQGQLLPQDPTDEPAALLLKKLQAAKAATGKKGKAGALFEEEVEAVEGPFEIPANWAWCELKELMVSASTGPFGSMLHKHDYVFGGIPLVNPMNIVEGKIVPSEKMTVTPDTKKRLTSYILDAGDIVAARRGEMGRCAIVTDKEDGWLCGTGSFFMKLNKLIDNEYFVRVFRSEYSKNYLLSASVGSTMNNLNHRILNKLLIPLPPLAEQRRIVSKLEQLMQHCDALEQRIRESRRLAEQLLQTALREALAPPVGTEPAEEAELELAEAETSAPPKAKRGRPRRPAFTLENAPPDLFDAIQFDE